MALYECKPCKYSTPIKFNFNKHIKTAKHLGNIKQKKTKCYTCPNCKKEYTARNSLWYHEKKCFPPEKEIISETITIPQQMLFSQQDVMELMLNRISILEGLIINKPNTDAMTITNYSPQETTINNTQNNVQHNEFNLNFFLNETCKDAINMSEFIESITCDINDVIRVGKIGYVDGISEIIKRKLDDLGQFKRPIHCSDLKRQSMHIKDNDVWEKDNDMHEKLHAILSVITRLNSRAVCYYKDKFPDCLRGDSKYADQYSKIVYEAMGGDYVDINMGKDKIIAKLAKDVIINKRFLN
jgi:hypothetical protein